MRTDPRAPEVPVNVIKQIRSFNAGRDPERLALKYRNMRSDPFVFLRATCHLFYARLPLEPVMRKAPAAWACGDLHLENFGSYKGDNRQVYFDLNDFDEALLAPLTWDAVRGLASILVGGRTLHRNPAVPPRLCEVFLDAYAQALSDGKPRWVERETAVPPVSDLLQAVRTRSRPDFLDSRTEQRGRRRRIRIDGRKALAATPQQRAAVEAFFADFAAQQPEPRFFEVLDVARRIAGTGSLGVDRYVVLVRGKGSPDRNYLLDLKQALPASPLPQVSRVPLPQPAWADEAQRTVAVQQRMQAVAMAFLHPVSMGGRPYVLRALQPSEDRVALAGAGLRHPVARLENLVTVMAQCLAWAQLRSSGRDGSATADELIDFAQGRKWRRQLMEVARHCAAEVENDWKLFAAAYDAGAMS